MGAEVVNLRQFKKAKNRADKDRQADQNRLSHGRTKAEKELTRLINEKAEMAHDQGRIEKPKANE
ncbi:DUF4169 family protein [Agrobacterium sp. ES01]|uniref:DUF4169 family protein n=1 Tax=Agrobacterium sp. ES01 TaxID=3420714 RepID=UPI003D10F502